MDTADVPPPPDEIRDEVTSSERREAAEEKKQKRSVMWHVILWSAALVLLILVAAVISFAVLRLAESDESGPPLRVGHLMAFTGGSSAMGYGTSKGIELAQKELEADNVEIIQVDSQCDPKIAQDAMRSLIEQEVQVVIGDGCSSASVAVLPMANNAQIPMISPSASSPALSIPDDYFFRVIPSDRYQGPFMAEAMHEAGHRRVAVFYTNEPYGSGINEQFRERFEALGGEVVATVSAEPDVIELGAQLDEARATEPDALFIAPNSVVTGAAVLQESRDVGLDVPMYGADIFYDTTIIANAPQASEGLTISTFSTGTAAFKEALVAEYKIQEQLYAAAQAYDAFEAMYRAHQMGARSGADFKEMLPDISFDGVSTFIQFNADGEIEGDDYTYDLLEVRDGEFITKEPDVEN